MWIYYQEPAPANRGLTFGKSGFTVKVYVGGKHRTDINADTNVAQTEGTDDQGNPDHSIQFFVSTKNDEGHYGPSLKIKIVVTGLISINHEATFTLPDTVDIDTIQTTSLEDGD